MSMSKRFNELSNFISKNMRMSHIYQPVMLIELLRRGGKASANEIAKAILLHDPSQIEYYRQITHNMVGRVLTRNHGITSRDKELYALNGFANLSREETSRLIVLNFAVTARILKQNYYEFTTVHHFGASEFPPPLAEIHIKSGRYTERARSSAG